MSTQLRPAGEIAREFNASTRNLITKLEKKSRSEEELANLDRLKKRISLLKSTMGETALVMEASPFFIEYAERILEPDQATREKFFMELDVRSEYIKRKGSVSKQDEFVFGLTDSIRNHYKKSSQQERDEVYKEVKTMLACCTELALIS